jgi:transcriptional regulator with XRE-family HTH domain
MKKDNVAVLLGRRIRTLRKSKGWTQEELGASCSTNYKYIGAIERGEENPSLSVLQKIAEGLGVEISELFRDHHEERDPGKIRKEIVETVNRIGKEEEEKLRLIVRILDALK